MTQRKQWQLGLAICLITGGLLFDTARAIAQSNIVPDNTLGAEPSNVTPNFNGLPVEAITGGAQRGQNLFHSFREFNVSAGRGAYFFSPDAIQNILARVTGTNRSEILGTLGTLSNSQPNLFLINPNGIIFGPGASLDVGGSFVATTANALKFGGLGQFSATNPNPPGLLTINPSAFLYNQIIPGNAVRTSAQLEVPTEKSFLLVGGDVHMDRAFAGVLNGHVELGGLSEPGEIGLSQIGDRWSLQFPENVGRSDVAIANQSALFVGGSRGGSLTISARNLDISGQSTIFGGVLSGTGGVGNRSGDLTFDTTGAITLRQDSIVGNSVSRQSISDGGDVIIRANSLRVSEGSQIQVGHTGQGNGGNIRIDAQDAVTFDGVGAFPTFATTFGNAGQGNLGDIRITAGTLAVTNGALLSTQIITRPGNAGSVVVNTRDTITLDGGRATNNTGIGSDLGFDTVGYGGDIQLTTGSLRVVNGAQITANTFGRGNSGNILISTRDSAVFDGESEPFALSSGSLGTLPSNVSVRVSQSAQGNAGNIQINTGTLRIQNGAFLNAGTNGQGNAGNIMINAQGNVILDGEGQTSGVASSIQNSVSIGGTGNGGNIEISAESLSVTRGADLSTSVFPTGRGNAGNIIINIRDAVTFDGQGRPQADGNNVSGISSFVASGAVGNGGTIQLNSRALFVTNGAFLNASTLGQGNGGSFIINTRDTVTLNGIGINGLSSAIQTGVIGGQGRGGNIQITTGILSLTDQAFLNTLTVGQGDGGDLTIFTREAITLDRASNIRSGGGTDGIGNGGTVRIVTNVLSLDQGSTIASPHFGLGNGGDLRIDVNSMRLDNGSAIGTSTASGQGGNITLNVQDLILLRHNSLISSSGGVNVPGRSGAGDGGNITINAPKGFIVGVKQENSDITANAFTGSGGRINITAQGIYGLQFRPQLTSFSDITASSRFGVSGIVLLNTPDVDPNRGLLQLPVALTDASQQIVQTCVPRGAQRASSFVITGRGGIPSSPTEPLQDEGVLADWVSLRDEGGGTKTEGRRNRRVSSLSSPTSSPSSPSHSPLPPAPIIEANGWIRDADGTIALVAIAPTTVPRNPVLTPVFCP